MVLDIFNYEFIWKALFAGSMIGASCAILGVFLVMRHMSLLGDGLAHSSFAGIAAGLLLNVYPIFAALGFAGIAAIIVQALVDRKKIYGDSAIAVVLAFGMSLALILVGLAGGFNTGLFSYLFGSILTLEWRDVYIILTITIITLVFVMSFYRSLLFTTFSREIAKVRNIKTTLLSYAFVVLVAFTVVIAIRAVGILLVSSLLVLPALISLEVSKSFKGTILYSLVFSILSIWLGVIFSYYVDIPTGATIVMILCIVYFVSLSLEKIKKLITNSGN